MGRNDLPTYSFYRLVWQSLDWLFPPHCGGCDHLGVRWCQECQASVKIINGDLCPRCGYPQTGSMICQNCENLMPTYQFLRSWAIFKGPLREAIHKLKYRQDMGLGELLAQPMISLVKNLGWHIDIVVPVPLSKERFRQRGYNQAGLLALPLALAINKPYRPNALQRWRNTTSQVGLTVSQRAANVAGAFKAIDQLIKNQHVLVIDDVTTTGATIQACAESLLQGGAKEVLGLTLARSI